MAGIIYSFNDNLLRAEGLSTVNTSGVLTLLDGGASVTCTLTDAAGVSLAGESWPISLTYTGSGGNFQGILRDSITWPANGTSILARLIVDNGADQRGDFIGQLTVQQRQF